MIDVNLAQVWQVVQGANWVLLTMVMGMFFGQLCLRAKRQQLLIQASNPSIRFSQNLSALVIGFFLINTLPARMGEFARPILLKQSSNTSFGASFSMMVVERLFDLCSALIMAIFTVSLTNMRGIEAAWIQPMQQISIVILGITLVLMTSLFLSAQWWNRLLQGRFPLWIDGFLMSFLDNIEQLRTERLLVRIIALTILTWALSAGMFVVTAWAFGVENLIGYFEGIGLLAITMLSMVPPNAPGFLGAYEASCVAGLQLFGVASPNTAFAFAFTAHWLTWIFQALLALYFLGTEKISLSQLWWTIQQRDRPTDAVNPAPNDSNPT
jgi:hypothetical protein